MYIHGTCVCRIEHLDIGTVGIVVTERHQNHRNMLFIAVISERSTQCKRVGIRQ